ncbi:hypothetical protein IQ06DRAFT_301730 [Phaeosphaeriaceae sp. SRC1lsM3a]|nr:hypothetical protein IQ06DRAFT_301730 [Stagonospora sp. SRC1lsM3a]
MVMAGHSSLGIFTHDDDDERFPEPGTHSSFRSTPAGNSKQREVVCLSGPRDHCSIRVPLPTASWPKRTVPTPTEFQWKKVADAIHNHGKSYHFGNSRGETTEGLLSILIATSVAARGLDMPGLATVHMFSWDFPRCPRNGAWASTAGQALPASLSTLHSLRRFQVKKINGNIGNFEFKAKFAAETSKKAQLNDDTGKRRLGLRPYSLGFCHGIAAHSIVSRHRESVHRYDLRHPLQEV